MFGDPELRRRWNRWKEGLVTAFNETASPHCDERILHAPGACRYCDECPQLQAARERWGIAFTSAQRADLMPCPSEMRRPLEVIEKWPGNRPKPRRGIAEGEISKGGQNDPPTTERPPPPMGQRAPEKPAAPRNEQVHSDGRVRSTGPDFSEQRAALRAELRGLQDLVEDQSRGHLGLSGLDDQTLSFDASVGVAGFGEEVMHMFRLPARLLAMHERAAEIRGKLDAMGWEDPAPRR